MKVRPEIMENLSDPWNSGQKIRKICYRLTVAVNRGLRLEHSRRERDLHSCVKIILLFRPIFPKMAALAGCGWLLKLAGAKPRKFKQAGILLHHSVVVRVLYLSNVQTWDFFIFDLKFLEHLLISSSFLPGPGGASGKAIQNEWTFMTPIPSLAMYDRSFWSALWFTWTTWSELTLAFVRSVRKELLSLSCHAEEEEEGL